MRRKTYSKDLKAKVALMALRAQKTNGEIVTDHGASKVLFFTTTPL